MKWWARTTRTARAAAKFAYGLVNTEHPLLVQIIPIRRCNIDCGYCNEYDKVSAPVPPDRMLARIDRLAELHASVVAFSGGEPMLHPQLEDLIRRIRQHGMIAGLITNGYLLSQKKIEALNEAGLDYMQISIDNVEPDEVSKKSLRLLDKKLQWLAQYATFDVNINSVVGGGTKNPEDARTVSRRARELGFSTSIGIIHDGSGQLKALNGLSRRVYDEVSSEISPAHFIAKNLYSGVRGFQDNLAAGQANEWRCRAGARYLYVCEDGLVHFCSQQRGWPGIPLEQYTIEHVRAAFDMPKSCAPYCTIGCVHRVSTMDYWRRPQQSRVDADLNELVAERVRT
jgi:MoaA/NifB/PqqE/SkfB family radical SAM enzyme